MDTELEAKDPCQDLQDMQELLAQYPPEVSFKAGTRKIANLPKSCTHKEHKPPMHAHHENGIYEHYCPACGKRTVFVVNHPTM